CAAVDRLVFHAVDSSGVECFERAQASLRALLGGLARQGDAVALSDLVEAVALAGYRWGPSDGN
ncbi:MAG: hypothetical protein KDK70_11250, partial [Myxococcales bacterium]|nr:hypothetical protein [Myxococcales bacterium]